MGLQWFVIILFLRFACFDSHPLPAFLEACFNLTWQFLQLDVQPSSGFLSLTLTHQSRACTVCDAYAPEISDRDTACMVILLNAERR